MNENYKKAIMWVKEKLNEKDIVDFNPESHLHCQSLHKILIIHYWNLENTNGFIQKNSYYQVKKLKDWLKNN